MLPCLLTIRPHIPFKNSILFSSAHCILVLDTRFRSFGGHTPLVMEWQHYRSFCFVLSLRVHFFCRLPRFVPRKENYLWKDKQDLKADICFKRWEVTYLQSTFVLINPVQTRLFYVIERKYASFGPIEINIFINCVYGITVKVKIAPNNNAI